SAVRLRTASLEQDFVTPPWNLRQLLGQPGQITAGSGLTNASFELLYGITISIDYPNDKSADINLHLSELGARFGEVPGCIPTESFTDAVRKQAFADYQSVWGESYAKYQSRLAALEIWQDPNVEKELELTDWLTFSRREGDMADPINPQSRK